MLVLPIVEGKPTESELAVRPWFWIYFSKHDVDLHFPSFLWCFNQLNTQKREPRDKVFGRTLYKREVKRDCHSLKSKYHFDEMVGVAYSGSYQNDILTTSNTATDDNFVNMTKFPFQWMMTSPWSKHSYYSFNCWCPSHKGLGRGHHHDHGDCKCPMLGPGP